jgi:uncharacterized RDD family membrane protein YckC
MMILIGSFVFLMGLGLLLATQIGLLTRDGQSVGKRMVGSRIVCCEDGSNPGFVRAVLLRSGMPFLWYSVPTILGARFPVLTPWVPLAGSLISLVDVCLIFGAERRCLHDRIAGTCVVQD